MRGYLLEESLAWLLRFSGYRLLVHQDQDPVELVTQGDTLRVRGRGALHQVDVLSEFALTPAFSMPVRLFLEAKYYQDRCGLEIVRNAHGVVHDVNENFMTGLGTGPRQRYKYSYALFSTSGFTADAQRYALAHQISLVDLSGASFAWLLGYIGATASSLDRAQKHLPSSTPFPVTWMRTELRRALETSPLRLLSPVSVAEERFKQAAGSAVAEFAAVLRRRSDAELLLGFPSAPFILPLAADDHRRFLEYAEHAEGGASVGAGRP
ncbi:restriction endonuclease [Acrocarpospora macrocephala]|uniref:restriction endonuclease n=1 Tax=Acrocarpospora macrocephala TaxID=150177 RepID=UPI001C3FB346|nr:restriction endonuclease [Acrocarpospora macrocephala]